MWLALAGLLGRTKQPQQQVDIVTALRQQRWGCGILVAPISSNVRVGEMPPANWLGMNNARDVTDNTLLDKEFAKHDIWCKTNDNLAMHLIENAYKNSINTLWNVLLACSFSSSALLLVLKKLSPIMERLAFSRRTIAPDMSATERLTLELERFCNSGDYAVGDAVNCSSVILASRSCANDEKAWWCL
ncbi:hypothetical protein HG530_004694 [Fusarium avenaceum]|nr:hypothetical protein HG530_004694 [Fusarium avenaceum]